MLRRRGAYQLGVGWRVNDGMWRHHLMEGKGVTLDDPVTRNRVGTVSCSMQVPKVDRRGGRYRVRRESIFRCKGDSLVTDVSSVSRCGKYYSEWKLQVSL